MAYDAFISYAHSAGHRLAAAFELALESLGKRWDEPRALDVFRDTSDQGLTADLTGDLRARLDGSRFLVLLASPAAAGSSWVGQEVVHWLAGHDVATVLLVLVGGDLRWDVDRGRFDPEATTALPPALVAACATEPKWVDLRWANTGTADLTGERFADAVADVSARIQGRSKDEIVGAQQREQRKLLARTAAQRAEFLVTTSAEEALLLAAAANDLDDNPDTRVALASVLEAAAGLVAVLGHEGRVTALAAHPTADEVVVGTSTGEVEAWDARTGARRRSTVVGAGAVRGLAVRADGRRVAVLSTEGPATVLDDALRPVAQVPALAGADRCALSAAGDVLAVAGAGGGIGGTVRFEVWGLGPVGRRCSGTVEGGPLRHLSISPDGAELWLFGHGSRVVVDARSGAVLGQDGQPFLPRPGPLSYTPDGAHGVMAQFDGGGITVFRSADYPSSGSEVFLQARAGVAECVALSSDASVVALAGEGHLSVLEVAGPGRASGIGLPDAITDVVVARHGSAVAVRNPRTAHLHVPGRRTAVGRALPFDPIDLPSVVQGVISGDFSPSGTRFAWVVAPDRAVTHARDVTVAVWDLGAAVVVNAFDTGVAFGVRFVDDGVVMVRDLDGEVPWDVTAGVPIPLDVPGGRLARPADSVVWTAPDGSPRVLVPAGDRVVDHGRRTDVTPPGAPIAYGPVVASRGARLAIRREPGLVEAYDLDGPPGDAIDVVDVGNPWATSLAFGPGGRLLAIAEVGRDVRVRDVEAGADVASLPVRGPNDVVVVGDGPDATVATLAGTQLTLFDVATELVSGRFAGRPAPARRLFAGADGRTLAECVAGGGATLWPVAADHWRATARRIAGRELTPDEKRRFRLDGPALGHRRDGDATR